MLKTLCCALALAGTLAGGAAVAAAPAELPRGSLVIIGGGLQADNAEVWQKIVALAGGKGARIAVLPTAAGNPEREGQLTVANLNRHGAQAFVVPLAPRLPGRDVRKDADDPALARALVDAGGVFFTGGDQGRITASLRHPDGSNTAVLDALWAPGLGFIGDDVFVDQHLLVRGRFARMLPAMLAKHYVLGLGIDENTAAVIGPGRDVTMIGYRGAIVLDLAQASSDKTQPGFNLANARISYLDSGDRFNLATRTFYPGPGKARINEAVPEHRPPIFYTDILGNTTVVNLLEKLVDSDQQRAVGVAFGAPGSPMAERGFEFTFTRMPDSGEFATNREDAFSIYRIRMDVRPVRVRQPFYTAE